MASFLSPSNQVTAMSSQTILRRYWRQLGIATNWPVLAAVAVLVTLGMISIVADSPSDAVRQVIFLVVAIACMLAFQTVNYLVIGRWAWLFYFGSLLMLLY